MAIPRISKEDLKELLEKEKDTSPIIVDVRLKYPYEHSTVKLPGAIRLVPTEIEFRELPKDRNVVAYDSDPEEIVSASVTAKLIRAGYRASALKGGISEWLAAKYPTETKEAPKQKPPVAGALKG